MRTPATDIEATWRRALEGDTVSFWALVKPHEQMIFAVAVGVAGDREAAADVAHDVYLRAFSTLGNLRSPQALKSWLYSMTRNVAHEHLRRGARRDKAARAAAEQSERVISVPDMLVKREELDLLRACMEDLPEAHRTVLALKYSSGMKCRDIAETLGISTEAAKSRLFEARKALRARMKAAGQPAADPPASHQRGEQDARNAGQK